METAITNAAEVKQTPQMKLVEQVEAARIDLLQKLAVVEWLRSTVAPLVARCSDSFRADVSIGIPYFYVYNRDDLATLMTLAPRWEKYKGGKTIQYTANINGYLVTIWAADGALPPTCRVIKTVRQVPATEAHEVIEEAIVCETAAAAEKGVA